MLKFSGLKRQLLHGAGTDLPQKYFKTHWGGEAHICVGNLTIIGSDNGLSPRRRQAIIWTNAGILLVGPLATNFIEILIGIQIFSFTKMRLKVSSVKWRPFCFGLNEFKGYTNVTVDAVCRKYILFTYQISVLRLSVWLTEIDPQPSISFQLAIHRTRNWAFKNNALWLFHIERSSFCAWGEK